MQFEFLEPRTIGEAISLLAKYDGKAKVIAGGTDLLVQIRNKAINPEYVIDISSIPGLDYVRCNSTQELSIGTLTTIRTLERSLELKQRYPVISQAASQLGSTAIRNAGTIGGNLCNAAPSAETAPALIGLSARVKIIGPDGERIMFLEDFFIGPGNTALTKGELLMEVNVPVLPPNTRGVYLKHGIRGSIDLAIVGVAVIITLAGETCKDIKLVLGAVAPTPMRARRAEELIRGKKIDETLVTQAAREASKEARPISDVRATAEYRKEMVEVCVGRAIKEALAKSV